ncbi:MAG: low affinity iron permease family protein [Thermomicrobiales bacterium]
MAKKFTHFANAVASLAGQYYTFIAAVMLVVVWAISGPFFGFSEVWQLVINTGTTIITFLMVFLIQNTQNRDSKAIHLKLDELLRAGANTDDVIISAEDATDAELDELKAKYDALCRQQDILQATIEKKSAAFAPSQTERAA